MWKTSTEAELLYLWQSALVRGSECWDSAARVAVVFAFSYCLWSPYMGLWIGCLRVLKPVMTGFPQGVTQKRARRRGCMVYPHLGSIFPHLHHILLPRMESLSLIQIKGGGELYTTSLVAQMVKNLPAIQETQFRSLGWEDSLEKGMATPSSILAWRIPRTEEPGGL